MRVTSFETDTEEFKRFNGFLSERWNLVFLVSIETGLRISDVLSLRPDDLSSGTLEVTERKTKNVRSVEFSKQLLERLRNYSLGNKFWVFESPRTKRKPVTRQAAWCAIKKAAKFAGCEKNIGPHSGRKSYARQLYRDGVLLQDIQQILGHKHLSTTLIYVFT